MRVLIVFFYVKKKLNLYSLIVGDKMPISDYHKSINQELAILRNRVRDLIEPRIHWGEDGRYKEAIFKQILRRHIPKSLEIGTGFVKLENNTTSQIDILLTNENGPVLFREDDFKIVSPSQVSAIIEVKTSVTKSSLKEAIDKLADNVSAIRKFKSAQRFYGIGSSSSVDPWCGLFVYDTPDIKPEEVLKIMLESSKNLLSRSIQAVCLGPNSFVRLWTQSPNHETPIINPTWHHYQLDDLAYSYFIGNALWLQEETHPEQINWFPIPGGKESFRTHKIHMNPPYDHF